MQICHLKIPTSITELLDEDTSIRNQKLGCCVSSLNFRRDEHPVNSTETNSFIV